MYISKPTTGWGEKFKKVWGPPIVYRSNIDVVKNYLLTSGTPLFLFWVWVWVWHHCEEKGFSVVLSVYSFWHLYLTFLQWIISNKQFCFIMKNHVYIFHEFVWKYVLPLNLISTSIKGYKKMVACYTL